MKTTETYITGGTLIDRTGAIPTENMTIQIVDGRIKTIDRCGFRPPAGAVVIDAGSDTSCPDS